MTKNNHPITPPPELVEQWRTDYMGRGHAFIDVAKEIAQWGADQELEACCEWLGDAPVVYNDNGDLHPGSYLRDARRLKPPTLKEQALSEVAGAVAGGNITPERGAIIRLALEALPND